MDHISTSENRKCVICSHVTPERISFIKSDQIEIQIPICNKCQNLVGIRLDTTMKSILSLAKDCVLDSYLITSDEKKLRDIRMAEREREQNV